MTNTDLDVSDELWKTFSDDQKIRHIHDNLVNLRKEIKNNEPICDILEKRIEKCEKSKKWKNIYALIGGFIGGIISGKGSQHLP